MIYNSCRVNFEAVKACKRPRLQKAAQRLLSSSGPSDLKAGLAAFRLRHRSWLEDSAQFEILCSLPELSDKVWGARGTSRY